MGVINITPDSFSDGNQYNKHQSFADKFREIQTWAQIIDIGAESTAPFNDAVVDTEELKRFEQVFFPFLESNPDPEIYISIDSYKLETFRIVFEKIKTHWPKTKVVFNDVSGKLEDELLAFLNQNPEIVYVFCHNLCPDRVSTGRHMDYVSKVSPNQFLVSIVDYFKKGLERLKDLDNEIWIDPCFGFSKTRKQNHFLISHFKSFLLQIPYEISCVVGLSRKSFLRVPKDADIKTPQGLVNVEQVHSNILFYLFRSPLKRELIVRTHDPAPIDNAQNSLNFFEV